MSATSTGIPPLIEQQLLVLDKQLRDAAFVRGVGRLILGVCMIAGSSLLLDSWLDLSGMLRGGLLASWIVISCSLVWRGLIRPAVQPVSFASLAAVVEQRFPELRERLTSLVELRGEQTEDLAPGASKLMQDLLARQTVKALDRITIDEAASTQGSLRTILVACAAVLIMLAPFVWAPDSYALLWGRFFAPWGNFSWGSRFDVKVVEGDQVVARGADVPVHVTLSDRRRGRELDRSQLDPLWLSWNDEKGAADSRRLEGDEQSQEFVTTLPHVLNSLIFYVTTTGAKSGLHRVDVSDPPAITQLKLELEAAAYTGLPAKVLMGVPGEIRVPEFTRVGVTVEFAEPVASAVMTWPALSDEPPRLGSRQEQRATVDKSIPLQLAVDGRSGTANAVAAVSGSFVVRAKNQYGLQNNDPSRTISVVADRAPEIKWDGSEEPLLVRPDDVVELSVQVHDDYGLSALELQAETTAGTKYVDAVPAAERRESDLTYKFTLKMAPLELTTGQAVTVRVRAADNRPEPNPQEAWTPFRSLMVNSTLKQLPDLELAQEEKSLEDEVTKLRSELNETKAELAELHHQTEQEALDKQPESDKTEQLERLRDAQAELAERLEQLADRLADRRMTQNLATAPQQIAENDIKAAQERLEQSKGSEARNQLEPLAKALDHLGQADRQLQQLERQLNDANKLEQDLAELSRMAQRAERLAEQLEKLDAQQAKQPPAAQQVAMNEGRPAAANNPASQSEVQRKASATAGNPESETAKDRDEAGKTPPKQDDDAGIPQQLRDEGRKLTEQMNEILKKHPELLEAARRDQVDNLNGLAEQAKQLAGPQERLAQSLAEAAERLPAPASRPENIDQQRPNREQAVSPDEQSVRAQDSSENSSSPSQPQPNAAPNADPSKETRKPAAANEKTSESTPGPSGTNSSKDNTTAPAGTDEGANPPSNSKPGSQAPDAKTETSDAQQPANSPKSTDQQAASDKPGASSPQSNGSDQSQSSPPTGTPNEGAGKTPKPVNPTSTSQPGTETSSESKREPATPNGSQTEKTPAGPDASQANSKPDSSNSTTSDGKPGATTSPLADNKPSPPNSASAEANPNGARAPASDSKPGQTGSQPADNKPSSANSSSADAKPNDANAPASDSKPGATNPPASDSKPTGAGMPSEGNPAPNSTDASSAAKPQQPGQPNQQNSSATGPSTSAEPKSNPQQQAGGNAVQRQEQMARDATKQALDLARETGADSQATKAAAEFAHQAGAAKQQAQSGELSAAAKEARDAAKSADAAAQQLSPDGQTNSPQAKQAQQLANQQKELAQQLEQLAKSPDAKQGAQLQGQQKLADATRKLAEQLDKAANALKYTPLDSPKERELSEEATKSAKQAEASMKQAAQANQQNDAPQAAKSAQEAAEKLQQVSKTLGPVAQQKPSSPTVPKDMGSKVLDAKKQLETAQKELSQCNGNCPNPAGSGQSASSSSSSKPGSNPSSPVASQQGAQPSPPSSQSPPSGGQPKPNSQSTASSSEPKSQNSTAQASKPGSQPSQGKPQGSQSTGSPSSSQSQQASNSGKSSADSNSTGQNPQGSNPSGQSGSGSQPGSGSAGSKPTGQPSQTGNVASSSSTGGQPVGSAQGTKPADQGSPSNAATQGSSSGKPGSASEGSRKSNEDQQVAQSNASPQQGPGAGQMKANANSQGPGKPNQEPPSSQQSGQGASTPSQVAERFREVAAMLRDARGDTKSAPSPRQTASRQRSGRSMPGQQAEPSSGSESGDSATGVNTTPDLSHLDVELQQQARQNWGRLPGQLRTEILQGAGKKPHPEYSQRIKSYFDEITKPSK